jgi:hypothetical protein
MEAHGKSETELLVLLYEALRKFDVCKDVRISDVERIDDDGSGINWDASLVSGPGTPIPSDCERAFIAAKANLRRQYFLLTDD